MKDWFDREQIWCVVCGYWWVLASNKEITTKQHNIWIRKVMKHHKQIRKEKEDKHVL